jgi:predicted NBD/HSP70 family sugar kinase
MVRNVIYFRKGFGMREKKLTTSKVKTFNRHIIYKLVYEEKEISRQEIANKLMLSLPTVNQNLKLLKEMGIIDYAGNFQSTGGRKAQVIVPVTNARVAIGIDIRKNEVRILMVDLYGTVIDYEKHVLEFSENINYSQCLSDLIENLINRNHSRRENILGVGISVPGVLTSNLDEIEYAPSLEIENYPIEKLTNCIQYPCIVENDANAGALTVVWNQSNKEPKIYLTVEKGVGGCIILGDSILKGVHNRAGEFGHMTLIPDGKQCSCGKKGCLEAYISTATISENLEIELEDFFNEVEKGNKKYVTLWDNYLEYLCYGLDNLYKAFDTEIILGGHLTPYLETYMDKIIAKLAALNSFPRNKSSEKYLRLTNYYSRANAVGAALQWILKFIESI